MSQSRFPVFHEAELPFGDGKAAGRVSIFLPPGFQREAGTYPVVYCADGGSVSALGMTAGTTGRENAFRRHTAALAKIMQRRGIDCTYSAKEGDHDFEFWQSELPAALIWAFGSQTSAHIRHPIGTVRPASPAIATDSDQSS